MRAMMLHGFGDLRWEEVPDPEPAAGEVLLQVACVQPSVTEAMLINGAPVALHEDLVRRLSRGPIAFGGHEFAGIVRRSGPGVRGWREGERVVAVETVPRTDDSGRPMRPDYLGFTLPGAFAEQVVVPAGNLVRLPEQLSAAAAAAIQPATGALHAHRAAAIRPGETVLVIGCGVMGLHAIQLARRQHPGRLIAIGRSQGKQELAGRLGADVVLDGRSVDLIDRVLDLTGGQGAQAVLETAGGEPSMGLAGAETVHLAAAAAAPGGRIVLVSVLSDDSRLPLGLLRNKGISLLHPDTGPPGSGPETSFEVIDLISSGGLQVDLLITHRLAGLERIGKALALLTSRPVDLIGPPQVHSNASWEAGC